MASSHRGGEYQMYGNRAGNATRKGTTLISRAAGGEATSSSSEALKSPSAYEELLEYGREVGRSSYVTTVYTGQKDKEMPHDIERETRGTPLPNNILVTTETVVLKGAKQPQ